jgi:amyotrophic lateral sclerosis 2 protein
MWKLQGLISGKDGGGHRLATLFEWPPLASPPVKAVALGESSDQRELAVATLHQDGIIRILRPEIDSDGWHQISCWSGRYNDLCRWPEGCSVGGDEVTVLAVTEDGRVVALDASGLVIEALNISFCEQACGRRRRPVVAPPLVRTCAAGRGHVVLVDRQGKAWSWGKEPQSGIVSGQHEAEEAEHDGQDGDAHSLVFTRVDFLQGQRVASVAAGQEFSVALVESVKTADAVCLSPTLTHRLGQENGRPRPSATSSCPLGLPVSVQPTKSTAEATGKSAEGDNEQHLVELRRPRTLSPVADEDTVDQDAEGTARARQVERLAQSGMYINPSDALKYLTDQLAWLGTTGKEAESLAVANAVAAAATPRSERQSPEPQTPTSATAAAAASLYKASSAVADGVKQFSLTTVSRLSQSFSASTEKEPPGSENVVDGADIQMRDVGGGSAAVASVSVPLDNTPVAKCIHRRSQSTSMLDRLADGRSRRPTHSSQTTGVPETAADVAAAAAAGHDVWFWGRGRQGQAGLGDALDRLQPCLIPDLSGLSLRKVVCGRAHSLALTAAGAVYGWGENSRGQVSWSHPGSKVASPVHLVFPGGATAADVAANGDNSYVLTDDGQIVILGITKSSAVTLGDGGDEHIEHIAATTTMVTVKGLENTLITREEPADTAVTAFRTAEKLFLHRLEETNRRILEPLCAGRGRQGESAEVCRLLLSASQRLAGCVSSSVSATADSWRITHLDRTPAARRAPDLAAAFEDYAAALADCDAADSLQLDSGEFARLATVCIEVLGETEAADLDGEALLPAVLFAPLRQLPLYVKTLRAAADCGRRVKDNARALRVSQALEKAENVLAAADKTVERERGLLAKSKTFWSMHSQRFPSLRAYKRRVLLDSKSVPVNVGGHTNAFGKNWIILMSDVLVHAGYSSFAAHPLQTVWVETQAGVAGGAATSAGHPAAASSKHEITLLMPEDALVMVCPTAEAKHEWLQAIQRAVLDTLKAERETSPSSLASAFTPPITRRTRYKFQRLAELKGAEYIGSWMQGRMHGHGVLTWPDGQVYRGQMRQNEKHGFGRLEVPVARSGSGGSAASSGRSVYEGQWRCNRLDGDFCRIEYDNGDLYQGQVREGKPHGQGTFKQGKLGATTGASSGGGASVYIGEWSSGLRQGYGVGDNLATGEKYMGMWANNVRSGPGCVVTLDGIYYEGHFVHDKMSGRGLMLFEDETCYEGAFADAGVFSGQGCLTYANGDRLEGSFFGNYVDGMKFNGTVFKSREPPASMASPVTSRDSPFFRDKIGRFCVEADRKWTCVFAHYDDLLGLSQKLDVQKAGVTRTPTTSPGSPPATKENPHTPLAWEQVAILINQAKNARERQLGGGREFGAKLHHPASVDYGGSDLEGLEIIPDYFGASLDEAYYREVCEYLGRAFGSGGLHPLSSLIATVADNFNASYGTVRSHPRMLSHAVAELRSLVTRLYRIVQTLFPALPAPSDGCQWVANTAAAVDGQVERVQSTVVSPSSVILPHLLPRIFPSIFMLYTLRYKRDDDDYWARILKWNRHPDVALLAFLGVDQRFWALNLPGSGGSDDGGRSLVKDQHFSEAISSLQMIKNTFTPVWPALVDMRSYVAK